MAANGKFSESLWPALLHAKSACLSHNSNGDGIHCIDSFFKELDSTELDSTVEILVTNTVSDPDLQTHNVYCHRGVWSPHH